MPSRQFMHLLETCGVIGRRSDQLSEVTSVSCGSPSTVICISHVVVVTAPTALHSYYYPVFSTRLQKSILFIVAAETRGRSGAGARLSYVEFVNCLLRIAVSLLPTDAALEGGAVSGVDAGTPSHVNVLHSIVHAPDAGTAAGAAVAVSTAVDRAFRQLMVKLLQLLLYLLFNPSDEGSRGQLSCLCRLFISKLIILTI